MAGEERERGPIELVAEETKGFTSITVDAAEIEVYDFGDRVAIQMCDVMAWDNGDGDPIAGATILLAPGQREAWAKALLPPGTVPVAADRLAALEAIVEAAREMSRRYREWLAADPGDAAALASFPLKRARLAVEATLSALGPDDGGAEEGNR